MQWKKNTYINGHYSYCKITYINDIFYYEFCSSAQRSNIKSRLTSSLFGHLQIILGQISIKIFHRRFESEWLPRHTRPRRYFHCIILKNYFISHKKFNGDWNSNCIQMHFAIPFRHMIIIFRICDSVSFSPSPALFVSFKWSVPFCEIINRVYFAEIT